jgi:hypothetical protein
MQKLHQKEIHKTKVQALRQAARTVESIDIDNIYGEVIDFLCDVAESYEKYYGD